MDNSDYAVDWKAKIIAINIEQEAALRQRRYNFEDFETRVELIIEFIVHGSLYRELYSESGSKWVLMLRTLIDL